MCLLEILEANKKKSTEQTIPPAHLDRVLDSVTGTTHTHSAKRHESDTTN